MTTVTTNFTSWSAVKVNVSPWGCGVVAEFVLKWRHSFFGCPPHVDGTPVFYKLDTLYSLQHVVLYSWHIWVAVFSVWASFVTVAFSTDDTLNFSLTVFGRMSEILAVITLLDRNGNTKLFHLEYDPSL